MNCLHRIIPNKTYYYFNESSSNVQERKLNLFQMIARRLFGCYKETHLRTVQQKAYEATLYSESGLGFNPNDRARLNNIFMKAGKKFGKDAGYYMGLATFPKESDQKSEQASKERSTAQLKIRYQLDPTRLNNKAKTTQALSWRIEWDIQVIGEPKKHTFTLTKTSSVNNSDDIFTLTSPPNVSIAAESFASYCYLMKSSPHLPQNQKHYINQQHKNKLISCDYVCISNHNYEFVWDSQSINQESAK